MNWEREHYRGSGDLDPIVLIPATAFGLLFVTVIMSGAIMDRERALDPFLFFLPQMTGWVSVTLFWVWAVALAWINLPVRESFDLMEIK